MGVWPSDMVGRETLRVCGDSTRDANICCRSSRG